MVKGSHMTAEQRARVSASKKGKPMADATRQALLKANIGSHRVISAEQRAALSALRSGTKASPEARANMSAAKMRERNWRWCGGRRVWQARADAKRRLLGFVPLNAPFAGCEAHHIDQKYVIHIPKAMHQGIDHNVWTGKGMNKINTLATSWLTEDWT